MLRRYESFCCWLTTVFPKVLTSSLYLYGLYAYSFVVCLRLIGGSTGLLLAVLGILIVVHGLYTYFQVINRGPGSPLDFPELRRDLESGDGSPPEYLVKHSVQVKSNGNFRYCTKCETWKPDRSHHCSGCDRCHLKMDHHCPWFATCIGYKNHKFFIQFLLMSVVYTALALAVSCYEIYVFFQEETYVKEFINPHLLALAILSLCMFVSVGVFTAMSVYFLINNLTTIEYYEYSRYRNNLEIINDSYYRYSNQPNAQEMGNLYNLGKKKNWQVVMGTSWKEWLLPVVNRPYYNDFYLNNGLYFESDPVIYAKLRNNSDLQNRLLGELRSL